MSFFSYSVNASGSKNLRYVSNLTLSSLGVFDLFYLGENQVSSLFYQSFGSIDGVLEEHCSYFLLVWVFRCLIVFELFRLYFFWYILLSDLLCLLICKQCMANECWVKIKLTKWQAPTSGKKISGNPESILQVQVEMLSVAWCKVL